MKQEKGVLTIEATIILSTLIFFITLMLSFGRVYMAQYYVAHSLLQTGKALSFKAYKYETTEGSILAFMKDVVTSNDDSVIRILWNNGQIVPAIKETFRNVVTDGEKQLKYMGLEGGLSSMSFEGTEKTGNQLRIKVSYKVRLPFGFFGHEYVTLHQEIKTGLWSR